MYLRTTFLRFLLAVTCTLQTATYAVASGALPTFLVKTKDFVIPYNEFMIFALPDQLIHFEVLYEGTALDYSASVQGEALEQTGSSTWKYKAAETKGITTILIRQTGKRAATMKIHCMVMVPAEKVQKGNLNGFRIGSYENSKKSIYQKPKGFIEITESNKDMPLSPSFVLHDFKCKQTTKYPMYMVLNEKLILKLELIKEKLREAGHNVENIQIMSGYRTPYYNQKIGNVKYSRHLYGDAADFFIDNNNDYVMDDLNNDGVSNIKDSRLIYNLIDASGNQAWYSPFTGGMGLYRKNSRRTTFVHVDVRGYRARWGK